MKKFDFYHEERRLFEAVQSVGEGVFEKIHIINNSSFPEEKTEFRIYHSGGYCWDVSMERQYDEDGNEMPLYDFSENWDGFKQSGIEFAINEIESIET